METIEPRIALLPEKKLMGMRLAMSLADNRTGELWRSFLPRRREIQNSIGADLYSMQVYDPSYFHTFSLQREFEKWATIEVKDFDLVPNGMETYILPEGLYAVFHYKGLSTDTSIFQYIFSSWLPNSNYSLDIRPHFEILGEKYRNNHPDSEEEIWIPIKPKE
ncbi:GyrI-like domain-containing protein [Rufibacter roseolus]|uniref:GyrI-like domain-containing protein n=1 Tax=Rufibacter roseolus TaxID=2817375 RepID=UPI001FEF2C3F|nr:GyrI-like domain-containing protein [Rufibacter roseolus]